jgi:hypothetical protein
LTVFCSRHDDDFCRGGGGVLSTTICTARITTTTIHPAAIHEDIHVVNQIPFLDIVVVAIVMAYLEIARYALQRLCESRRLRSSDVSEFVVGSCKTLFSSFVVQ